jgi:two-component system chemotaxis response regulator CheB
MAFPYRSSKSAEPDFVPFGLIAIGASAGGLGPLLAILERLPEDFCIPIVVVHHLGAHLKSRLPEVLALRASLPCRWAADGEAPEAGWILVAPPGANLVLAAGGRLCRVVTTKPRMGWPSVDAFLYSMAAHLGPLGVAIVLSGMMQDGGAGVSAVRRSGGATFAQHPSSADFPGMPTAAVDLGRADLIMKPEQIAESLLILAQYGVR